MKSFYEFLKAVWDDWVALMSGLVGLVLGFIGTFFELNQSQARIGLIVASVGCVLFASFRVWKVTSERLTALADNNRPKLIGFIKGLQTSEWAKKTRNNDGTITSEPGYLRLTATLNLVNVGSVPTTIKNISCEFRVSGLAVGNGYASRPIGGYDELFVNQIFDYMEDAKPLKQGRHIEGEVEFDLPVKRSKVPDRLFDAATFSVRDAWEQEHLITSWATPSYDARPKTKRLREIERKKRSQEKA